MKTRMVLTTFVTVALLALALALTATAHAQSRLARYNEVYRTVTHNSYWVKRDNVVEAFASGAQERLLDQLLFEHVRGLEIDVHKKDSAPGLWSVYHTNMESNVFCSPFTECLKQLRQFQYALPQHEVVTVVIELKEILEYNWDSKHTPRDFDKLLEQYLGPYLFRPRELLSKCSPGTTLRQCVKEKGWPTIQELRGKFVFAILGNWRWCYIGHGGSGWAEYATWNGDNGAASGHGAVWARSAWPMASDFSDLTHESCGTEGVPHDKLQAAYDASALLQVEEMSNAPHMKDVAQFLEEGGVVRAGDTLGLGDQQSRIAWGAQMFQTDYPWLQFNNRGARQPFRPLRPEEFDGDLSQFDEPGRRLEFMRNSTGWGPSAGFSFAFQNVSDAYSDWETVPSATRPSPNASYPNAHWTRAKTCLRAEDDHGAFAVCRQTFDGKWNVSKPLGEDAVITVEETRNGKTNVRQFVTQAHSSAGGVGDQLRLVVVRGATKTCATAYSAAEILDSGVPRWTALRTQCFDTALTRQGVSAQWGDAIFFNTRRNGEPVDGAALAAVASLERGSGYAIEDTSVDPLLRTRTLARQTSYRMFQ